MSEKDNDHKMMDAVKNRQSLLEEFSHFLPLCIEKTCAIMFPYLRPEGSGFTVEITITQNELNKLLSMGNGDVALLYLYLHGGNDPENAGKALHMSSERLRCAGASLRQMGLWQEKKQTLIRREECPRYTEKDVVTAMEDGGDFRLVYGEVQRLMGRSLNTEELKILLGFTRYLGLPADVIAVLITYCKDRARQKGGVRSPSLRSIEKEAYAWAEQGIDTLEEAAAFIQNQNMRRSRLGTLMKLLQIRGRNLTPGEEKYASQWIQWGFDDEAISMAYERTCLNTGGLSWAYMNRILTRWQTAGLLTGADVRDKDKKPSAKAASGELGEAELEAIAKLIKEG